MKRSNFLLILFYCVLEREISHIFFVSGASTNSRAGSTPFSISAIAREEEGSDSQGTEDSHNHVARNQNKRKYFETDADLYDIEHINARLNMPLTIPKLVRPVPVQSIFQFPNDTHRQGEFIRQGDNNRQVEIAPTRVYGYTTPPPSQNIRIPTSNDSVISTASSVKTHSTASSVGSNPFTSLPRNLATLNTSGNLSLDPSLKEQFLIDSQSRSLFYDTTLPPLTFSSFPRPPGYWKHDGAFLSELRENGLRCDSDEFDLDSDEDNFTSRWVDDIVEVCDSTKPAKYRPTSETSELGKELAGTFLESRLSPKGFLCDEDCESSYLDESIPFEVEYAPWIPQEVEQSFLYGSLADLQDDFDLKPMNEEVETVELPETDEGRQFFRPIFKPFQDYGEFIYDEAELRAAVDIARPLSQERSAIIAKAHEEAFSKRSSQVSSTRHEAAVKYARSAHKLDLIEGAWIDSILNGMVIDFFEYYESIKDTEEIQKWSVRRCRKFICAIIPSIMFSINFEEVLIDFMDDFFLAHIIEMENESLECEAEQTAFIKELVKVGKDMIEHSISASIIETYLSYIKSLLVETDADNFYDILVDTMNNFSIPEPLVLPERKRPSRKDEKYTKITGGKDAKEKVYREDVKEYEDAVKSDKRKIRYQEDLIRVKTIHKNRSFDILRVLVTLFPEAIMKADSRWINPNYLNMPKIRTSESSRKETPSESAKKDKKDKHFIDKMLFGKDAHVNQDFFDALFFSRVLRAFLIHENTIDFVSGHLDPFLKANRINVNDSPIGFRFYKAVDRFIRITRFNVVANVLPQVINYRRYLIAYLIRNGANWMGIIPSKVQSRVINFEFVSLFEALHLYQVVDPSSASEREQRMKVLISTKEISYQIPIIYFAYNPISYQAIARIIEEVSKEVPGISFSKLNGYYEIFAMAKNIDLLPITERKVLKFTHIIKSEDDPVYELESNNQNLEFRPRLPEHYDAIYDWNMSRRLKNLSKLSTHLDYPYGLFASRILLARRFGVSFDASHFIPQLSENFTWLECVDFVNFFLEREAQILIDRSITGSLDSDLYQVYRVIDSQRALHQSQQMAMDEPTHHINLLIEAGFTGLPQSQTQSIKSKYSKEQLFMRYKRGLGTIEPAVLFQLSTKSAAKILEWFANDENLPESFDLTLVE